MLLSRLVVSMFQAGLMVMAASVVSGQDYPNKPIRIVTAVAGGGSDFYARQIAQGISCPLGQSVIVDNRGGGVIPMEAASKAPADGYTLLVNGANTWILPLVQKTSYDAVSDFSPISLIVREVNVLAVHPSVPVKSVKELIALAKARPGELNYGSSGVATPPHLCTELFKSMAGVNLVHVAYKGGAAATTALLAGEVQVPIIDAALITPHAKSGKLSALAVTSATPSPLVPDLPTIAASGLPGYEWIGMTAIFAPGKTPGAIINRLNQEIVRVINRTDVKERFSTAGAEAAGSSPEELAAIIKSDIAKMGKVIKDAGIRLD